MILMWEPLANIIVQLRLIVLSLKTVIPLDLIIFPGFPMIPLH